MKAGIFTHTFRVFKCLITIAILLCFIPRTQAQYIPIDTGFAITLTNSGYTAFVNNYQLDTVAAKAYNGNLYLYYVDVNHRPKSLEGLQYIGKDRVGLSVLGRQFEFHDAKSVTYIPDIPALYAKVEIIEADSLVNAPNVGDSVREYSLHGKGLQNLTNLPAFVKELSIQATSVSSLPALPSTLTTLAVSGNNLTSIPVLPVGLKYMEVNGNQLTALPALPSSITHLQCRDNYISVLPTLPAMLNVFNCSNNGLAVLPQLPSRLQVLGCTHNNLTSLPQLPDTLIALECSNNPLTVLPAMPKFINALYCDSCQLTVLPELAHTDLNSLNCAYNNLMVLPALPPNVTLSQPWGMDVIASNNQLDSITNFPAHLDQFTADNNNLSTLPVLNNRLYALSLTNNHISILPALPLGLRQLKIDSNPIVCLPYLPDTLTEMGISHTGVTCLPNIPSTLTTSLGVCTAADDCYTAGIGGRVYVDKNNNCVFDAGDFAFKNRILKLSGTNFYTKTDTTGRYNFIVGAGNYQIQLPPLVYPFVTNCTDSVIQVSYNGINQIDTIDFPLEALADCAILDVDISTLFVRMALPNTHYARVRNDGSNDATNVVLKIKFDPELTPLSSQPMWQQILPGNVFVYNLGTLIPQQEINIVITDSTSITAVPGQAACVKAYATALGLCQEPASPVWDSSHIEVQSMWIPGQDSIHFIIKNIGDVMAGPSQYRIYEEELLMLSEPFQLISNDSLIVKLPANGRTFRVEADQRTGHPGLSRPRDFMELAGAPPYILHHIVTVPQDDDDEWVEIDCHEIVASYDPNAKTVYPAGIGANHYVTKEDVLEYILQFQNTGNDTAFNIRLIDTLDTSLMDATTFKSGVSSHTYEVQMRGSNVVEWTFANIQLVDSATNEPGSHGFVKFKIKQLPGNQPGAVINNFLDIYFDYNEPVRTNTAFVTIEEKENIFPVSVIAIKPEAGYSIHVMPNPFTETANFEIATENTTHEQYGFELFDMLGRRIISKPVSSRFMLNRGDIGAGVYVFRLTNKGALIGSGKIVAR